MKKLLVFVVIGLFAWVAFVPPDGMKKFPSAKVEFNVETSQGTIKAQIGPIETSN